jgi:hypothetical protein
MAFQTCTIWVSNGILVKIAYFILYFILVFIPKTTEKYLPYV